ncbi:MAG: hypothetical protein AABY78_03130 [Nitrospirota bacterium]|jgi:hypothetical protein
MHKGTILYHQAFQFQNGEIGKKLLIILNTPQKDEPYLCCKTTSKQKYNIDKEGCHYNKNIYVIYPNTDWFKEKTWVQFHELYEIESGKFLKDHFDGKLEVKGTLKVNTISAIINCVKRSEDVSNYHLTLLR